MAQVVVMPKLGNTVESCIIVKWNIEEGQAVADIEDFASRLVLVDVNEHELGAELLNRHRKRDRGSYRSRADNGDFGSMFLVHISTLKKIYASVMPIT